MPVKYIDVDDSKKTELRPAIVTDQGVKIGELGDHHDNLTTTPSDEKNRGFVDGQGNFLNREQAAKVAKEEGHDVPAKLHSEDLNKATGTPDRPAGKIKFLDEAQPGAPASQKFSTEAKPAAQAGGFWDSFGTGLRDVAEAASQSGAHIIANGPTFLPGLGNDKMTTLRKKLVEDADTHASSREDKIQSEREAAGKTGVDWGRAAGNIAATLPLAALNPAVGGALSGSLTPVTEGDYSSEKLKQVALGAAGGKLADMAGNTLSKIAAPVRDSAKKALLEAGVDLTPGLVSGKVGKTVEKMMRSLPFTGDVVKSAEGHTLDTFNVATAKKALAPLGKDMVEGLRATNGREAVAEGQKVLSQAYDQTLDKIGTFRATPKFVEAMNSLDEMANELPTGLKEQYMNITRNRIGARLEGAGVGNGTMDGRTFKQVESELRHASQGLKASDDMGQRQVGHAIDAARDALRDALAEQNPQVAKELQQVNHAYSLFGDVERAAQQSATSQGQFTPSELLQAIRVADKSPRNRQFAAGSRPMQKWADDAYSVLGKIERSPDSAPWAKTNSIATVAGLAGLPLTAGHTEAGMEIMRKFMLGAPKTRNLLAGVAQGVGQVAAPGAAGAAAMLPNQGNNP